LGLDAAADLVFSEIDGSVWDPDAFSGLFTRAILRVYAAYAVARGVCFAIRSMPMKYDYSMFRICAYAIDVDERCMLHATCAPDQG
jgi:hypothetical protein